MSVSLYRWTKECEQDPQCVGDCDLCRKETMNDKYDEVGIPTEIEADGFITRAETLERINASKAKPAKECVYPRCEECDKYHGYYCTVPMVVTKQIWWMTSERIARLEKGLAELETLVTDEILGRRTQDGITMQRATKSQAEELNNLLNFTWDDYLGENK